MPTARAAFRARIDELMSRSRSRKMLRWLARRRSRAGCTHNQAMRYRAPGREIVDGTESIAQLAARD